MAEYLLKIDRIRSCYSETKGNCPFCFIAIKIGERHCSLSSCKCLTSKRPNDCPLVEVPSHGRLIDVDKLLEEHPRISPKYPSETFYENLDIFNMLDDAQTVIEASTEERK